MYIASKAACTAEAAARETILRRFKEAGCGDLSGNIVEARPHYTLSFNFIVIIMIMIITIIIIINIMVINLLLLLLLFVSL